MSEDGFKWFDYTDSFFCFCCCLHIWNWRDSLMALIHVYCGFRTFLDVWKPINNFIVADGRSENWIHLSNRWTNEKLIQQNISRWDSDGWTFSDDVTYVSMMIPISLFHFHFHVGLSCAQTEIWIKCLETSSLFIVQFLIDSPPHLLLQTVAQVLRSISKQRTEYIFQLNYFAIPLSEYRYRPGKQQNGKNIRFFSRIRHEFPFTRFHYSLRTRFSH